jgi:hypothetical protein
MNKIPAYIKPVHPNAYRKPNMPFPRISGVYNLIPSPDSPPRFGYEVTYEDGEVDFVPLSGGRRWSLADISFKYLTPLHERRMRDGTIRKSDNI